MPLDLDAEGQARHQAWQASADARAQNVVNQLLDDVKWRRNWKTDWGARQDPFERSDWFIRFDASLVVLIREFSDEDPQDKFGMWIGPEPDAEH